MNRVGLPVARAWIVAVSVFAIGGCKEKSFNQISQSCVNGTCGSACSPGETDCAGVCVNLDTHPQNCGRCGNTCPSGACVVGFCQGGGVAGNAGTGGTPAGTGGTAGVGVAGTGSTAGTGGSTTSDALGGYHQHGDWAGFAFTFADGGATISPDNYEGMLGDGPYCVSGQVPGTQLFSAIAAFGVNVNQEKIKDAPVNTLMAGGGGLLVDLTVNSGEDGIRIQLEGPGGYAAGETWCTNLTGSGETVIPWTSFNSACWSAEEGVDFDPATNPLAKAIAYVPDPGPSVGTLSFDFCINRIGPDTVTGRGQGKLVSSCNNNVSWSSTSTGELYANIGTSDNKYQFQSNGWNMGGGSHSISLLPSCGFRMDSQTCSMTGFSPCSFPSIYIGVDSDGTNRTNYGNGNQRRISEITSVPTCMGWSSGSAGANDEYNVSYDVWFNSSAGANQAETFLMVWYRDPPNYQPAGDFPDHNGLLIGDQTWVRWVGPNADGRTVVSYVASQNNFADGQAYDFDLKDFIDDAVERAVLSPNLYLISMMAGLEIWGGAQGAAITGFRADVQ